MAPVEFMDLCGRKKKRGPKDKIQKAIPKLWLLDNIKTLFLILLGVKQTNKQSLC